MTLIEAIAIKTKNLMQEKNISQQMLETKTNISHYSMNKILKCKYKDIDIVTMLKLCNAFGITINEFLNDDLFTMSNLQITNNSQHIDRKSTRLNSSHP